MASETLTCSEERCDGAATEFRVLGPVGAFVDGVAVPLGGPKQRTVLAALVLNQNRVLGDDRLARLLWKQDPPATDSAQIHTYVSRLRGRLGPAVTIDRKCCGYVFRAPTAWFDHVEFERLAARGHSDFACGHYESAASRLHQALAIWQGPALSGVTSCLAGAAGPGLAESRMAALETRAEIDLILGRNTSLVAELTGLVAEFPFRERLRAALMIALYRCGRQADALTVYHSGRRALVEETGLDPGETLAFTHRAVLTGDFSRTSFAGADARVSEKYRGPL